MSASLLHTPQHTDRGRVTPAQRQILILLGYIALLGALIALAGTAKASSDPYASSYQRRPVSITVWKGISPYGTNDRDVLNHVVFDLTRGRSARLEGVELSVLGNEVLEDAYGVNVGTFGVAVGGTMVGVQAAGVGVVAGEDLKGIQIGGLGAVAGDDARWVQAGGLAGVAGGDVLGIQFGGLAAVAGNHVTGAQAGGLAAVSGGNTRFVQIGGLAAVSGGGMLGAQGSALASVAGNNVTGAQVGGLAAVSGGDLVGVQGGGFAAVNGGHGSGVQIGGLAAVNGGGFSGIQAAGLASVAEGPVYGLQMSGLANVATDMRLMQAGTFNVAEEMHGLQLGFGNVAEESHGIQIGVINAVGNDEGSIAIGAITRSPNGPQKMDVWYAETGAAHVAYRSGTEHWTALVSVGYKPGDPSFLMLGWGSGYRVGLMNDRAHVEIEGMWHKINERDAWSRTPQWVATGRVLYSYQVSDRFGVFAGPTWNYYWSKLNDGADFAPTAADAPSNTGDPCTSKGTGALYAFRIECGGAYYTDIAGNGVRRIDLDEGLPTDPQISVGVNGKDNRIYIEKSGADLESIGAPDISLGNGALLYWREVQ